MARDRRAGWGWAGVLGVFAAIGVAAAAEKPPPRNFTFAKAADSPGTVTFSHQTHADAKITKCGDCHAPGKFKMKKASTPAVTMEAMNEGKVCGACHDGQKAFSVTDKAICSKCHKPG